MIGRLPLIAAALPAISDELIRAPARRPLLRLTMPPGPICVTLIPKFSIKGAVSPELFDQPAVAPDTRTRRTTSACKMSLICIGEPHDVILPEIASGLYLHHLKRDHPRVLEPVPAPHRDIG